jgi:hypothetical protein
MQRVTQSVAKARGLRPEAIKNLATIANMRFLVLLQAVGLFFCAVSAQAQAASPETAPPATSVSAPGSEPAEPVSKGIWRLMASPYSFHYSQDPNHKEVWMIGLEHQRTDGFILGGTYFSNSFGQPSGYVYAGQRLDHWSAYDQLFAQWTAGVIYGYKGEYKDKVPFNHNGFSPGVVLAVGWQFTPLYSIQFNVLGNSALMFQFSVDLP